MMRNKEPGVLRNLYRICRAYRIGSICVAASMCAAASFLLPIAGGSRPLARVRQHSTDPPTCADPCRQLHVWHGLARGRS